MKNDTCTYFAPTAVDHEDPESGEIIPGDWRQKSSAALTTIRKVSSNNYCQDARKLRDNLSVYLATKNIVSWQQKYVRTAAWNPSKGGSEGVHSG